MEHFNWETWGWLAAFCFGACGLPQAIKSIREKHSNGVSSGFLTLWALGEIFATIYIIPRRDIPLLVNYFVNAIFITIIVYYKIKGVKNETADTRTGKENSRRS